VGLDVGLNHPPHPGNPPINPTSRPQPLPAKDDPSNRSARETGIGSGCTRPVPVPLSRSYRCDSGFPDSPFSDNVLAHAGKNEPNGTRSPTLHPGRTPRRTNPRPARDRAAERTQPTVRPRWPGSRSSATRPNEPEAGEAKRTRDRRGIAWRNEPGRPSGAGWNVPERTRGSVLRGIASGFSMRSRRTGRPGERLTARRPYSINIVPPRGPLTHNPGGAA
jgi:hypothetical protein